MKYPILFVFAWTCLLSCKVLSQANAKGRLDQQIPSILDRNATSFLDDPQIYSLSIGVFIAGESYIQYYGELDPSKENKPSDHTLFEIASVSKSFAGTLVAQSVLDGKIDLDADIRDYLDGDYPNLEFQGHAIKVKHLLTHTAGLPRFLPLSINDCFETIDETLPFRINKIEEAYSKELFLEDLKAITLQEVPGTVYRYSNADVELIALILERVYDTTYEDLLQKVICEAAGMRRTKIRLSQEEETKLANGYGESNMLVPHFSNPLWGAGSGIKSTIPDLMKYVAFHLDSTHRAAIESRKLLYTNDALQIGYLWPIFTNEEDGTYYQIHGGAFGTQNMLLIAPKYNLGISVVTNQSGPTTQGKLSILIDGLFSELKTIRE